MTLAYLIELASHAAALDEYVTLEEYEARFFMIEPPLISTRPDGAL